MLRKTPPTGTRNVFFPEASMRPQRNAAENPVSSTHTPPGGIASMRPQRNAAENDWWDWIQANDMGLQ